MTSATCHCEWGFRSRRCACFRAGKACSADCPCGCKDCNNPFNGVLGVERFTDCARAHIVKFKLLLGKDLQAPHRLACGCGTAIPLRDLMEESVCPVCQTLSFYSFCLKEVVPLSKIKHCPHCQRCTEQVSSHCVDCGA
jgi:hypothetical protein